MNIYQHYLLTGNFTLIQSLDYERQNKYSFIITATFTDGTVAQADVEVIVEDVNDNCPRFNSTEITVFHTEPIAQNTLCLLYTSPSPRDGLLSRMPSSA